MQIKHFSLIFLLTLYMNVYGQFSGNGTGSLADPYLISNAQQLSEMRNFLGTANGSAHFKIINDIDVQSFITQTSNIEGWQPIGKKTAGDPEAFYGILDGSNFSINNLWISRTTEDYIGLFGNLKNATIKNVRINLANNGISGNNYVGALTAFVYGGSVMNCQMQGTINGNSYVGGLIGNVSQNVSVNNNSSIAVVNATGENAGGLIGKSESEITNCNSSGQVNTNNDYTGGLIGVATQAVTNSSSTSNVTNLSNAFNGNFIGGLIGSAQAIVNACNASGNITGSSNVGGLVGQTSGPLATISNSHATGNVTGRYWVGGLAGVADNIQNCYANGNVTGTHENVGGLVGALYGDIFGSHSSGKVSGTKSVGGLVGIAYGNIAKSYAVGNITQTTAPQMNSIDIGGLVGYSFNDIDNCYATGSIFADAAGSYIGGLVGLATNINHSYASGSIIGGQSIIGGLAGNLWGSGIIKNSAAINTVISPSTDVHISTIKRVVGVVNTGGVLENNFASAIMPINGINSNGTVDDESGQSHTISQFQQKLTYTQPLGWNFTNLWNIREGQGYPYFESEPYLTNIIISSVNNANGGSISPSGATAVPEGADQLYSINVNNGYEIEMILVDGTPVANANIYNFTNIVANHEIIVKFRQLSLSTNEIENNKDEIKIYPNPTSNILYVKSKNTINKIEIYNMVGQKVLEAKKELINVSNLSSGVYIVKVASNKGISEHKIIKK